jgi:transposase
MREDVRMPQRTRRVFSAQQKANAVRLVREVGNLEKVGRDLDINPHLLRRWVNRAALEPGNVPGGALTGDERAELTRLRRENRTLQMERDFLKKAAAFFAKDQDRPTS